MQFVSTIFTRVNYQTTSTSCLTLSTKKHNYRIRLASRTSFYLLKARANYGKFYIRFAGVKTWNSVNEKIKRAPVNSKFKNGLKKMS